MGLETTGLEQLFETYSMDILIPTFIGLIIGFAFIAFFGYRFLSGKFLNHFNFLSFCLLDLIPQNLLCYHVAVMKE